MVFKSSPPPPLPAILYILHYCAQKRGVAGLILTLPKSHCSMCHSMSTHVTIACSAMTRLSVVCDRRIRFHMMRFDFYWTNRNHVSISILPYPATQTKPRGQGLWHRPGNIW
ncbi:hypothetical protein T03_12576 [Trichinella britovi]|uniref:Uncharacterized protein n=1 Tax=Trichinella britovi TaxID=45882 RepID=A0A0V1CT80_TRIBR|nr:hypothetical protein T03_12576 [Trichinella britovi]